MSPAPTRVEHDLLGDRQVPAAAYYGVHTLRALENFPITGTSIAIYPDLVVALACVKHAAALANRELGLLDEAGALDDRVDEFGVAGGEFDAAHIIHIQHHAVQTRPGKEAPFGLPVSLHAAVVIQMVLGEIGEQGHADLRAIESGLFNADAGSFDGAGLDALLGKAAQR